MHTNTFLPVQTDHPTKATIIGCMTCNPWDLAKSSGVNSGQRSNPNDWALEQSRPGEPPLATMSSGEAGRGLS